MTAIDQSKLKYLRALRQRSGLTANEEHELRMAEDAYGERWWMFKPERRWSDSADRLGSFVSAKGRWPVVRTDDKNESHLASWLQNARHSARYGVKGWTAARGRYLDTVVPGWMAPSDQERWDANLAAVIAFHTERDLLPKASASDTEEAALGKWLAYQRRVSKNPQHRGSSVFTVERQSRLDEALPGWNAGLEEIWDSRAKEVGDFFVASKRWPSSNSADPNEAHLGEWFERQRGYARAGSAWLTPERHKLLDEVAPGWYEPQEADPWETSLLGAVSFFEQHGKLPSGKAESLDERRLKGWIQLQRKRARLGDLPDEQIQRLDQALPGWVARDSPSWGQRTDELARFVESNQRLPKQRSRETREAALAGWLTMQRSRLFTGRPRPLSEDHVLRLDSIAPRWRERRENVWEERAGDLLEFGRANGDGRPPTQRSRRN